MARQQDPREARLSRLERFGLARYGPQGREVWAVRDQLLVSSPQTDGVLEDVAKWGGKRLGSVRLPGTAAADRRVAKRLSPSEAAQLLQGGDASAGRSAVPAPQTVDVVALSPRKKVDPLELAQDLRARGRVVSPNHIVTALPGNRIGHPGDDPDPVPVRRIPALPPDADEGRGVRVAIVDTGFPMARPAVDWFTHRISFRATSDEQQVVGRYGHVDLLDDNGNQLLDPCAGHGLFVGGLVRSIAPAATLHFVKALDAFGLGTESGVIQAIGWAARRPIHVLNLSLGFYTDDDLPPPFMVEALTQARRRRRNLAIVASVGNDGLDSATDPTFPAHCDGVIKVGALNLRKSGPATFSNTGRVDVWAPGTRVVAPYVSGAEDPEWILGEAPDEFDGAARWSGTSFAAGLASGAIAAEAGRRAAASKTPVDAAGAWREIERGLGPDRHLVPQAAF
jgi:subtilisin family serine protease